MVISVVSLTRNVDTNYQAFNNENGYIFPTGFVQKIGVDAYFTGRLSYTTGVTCSNASNGKS